MARPITAMHIDETIDFFPGAALQPTEVHHARAQSLDTCSAAHIWPGKHRSGSAITNPPAARATATADLATDKPNILFIMGDDIGWMQPSIYHQGLMVGETPNIDRIGREGAKFMTYYAEQSCTAGRNAFFTGMNPLRTGMIPPQLPGSPSYLRPGTPALAKFLHRSRLHHRRVRQEPPGRPHRCAADRARLPGILGLPVSPRRDGAGELPGHQQESDHAGRSRRRARTRRSRVCPRSPARWIPRRRSA